jgi:hypothetical protein
VLGVTLGSDERARERFGLSDRGCTKSAADKSNGAKAANARIVDVRTVSALLGHSDPSTTLRLYAHLVTGAQERAVASIGNAVRAAQARRAAGEK